MTPTPSPSVAVEVFVPSGPAEWWQVLGALGPLAVLIGALIAGLVGWNTLQQKALADNRSEWWRRTQWALDAVNSGNTKQATMGLKVLKVLAESELAGEGELAVLEAAWEDPLKSAERKMTARTLTRRITRKPEDGLAVPSVRLAGEAAAGRGPGAGGGHPGPGSGVDGAPGPQDNGNDEPRPTAGGGQ